jgi:hypothetical protein
VEIHISHVDAPKAFSGREVRKKVGYFVEKFKSHIAGTGKFTTL